MKCIYCLIQIYLVVYLCLYIYIYNLLDRDQLHVSAFGNGHIQVKIEKLSKQLYSTYVGCIKWVVRGVVGTRSSMCYVGCVVWCRYLGFCYCILCLNI